MTGAERAEQHREETAIREVTARLAKRFPDRPAAEIDTAVCSQYRRFTEARIRDFIPVLVERAARDDLAHSSPRNG